MVPSDLAPGLRSLMQEKEGATRFLDPERSGRVGEERSRRGDDQANVA